MHSFKGPCPHQSTPVEMDERMTSSSLDLACPPLCELCSGHTEFSKTPEEHDCEPPQGAAHSMGQRQLPESQYQRAPREEWHAAPEPYVMPPAAAPSGLMEPPLPADVWPRGFRQQVALYGQDLRVGHNRSFVHSSNWPWGHSMEEAESLERPLPLIPDINSTYYIPSRYPAAHMPGPIKMQGHFLRQCACCPPANLHRHKNNYCHYQHDYPARPHQEPQHHPQLNPRLQFEGAPNVPRGSVPQRAAPHRDVMHEVSVDRSFLAGPGAATREFRRTINLSEECRNVFITYSVDVAKEIIPFVKFLVDQGFKPSIDMFDSTIQRMDITKWMDSFLNNKSVLIIVVISPKYKEDVEGAGDDEHGLHTKYIHNRIQNEFIQQGCLNFRLVPVLFPNATKRHVPNWLQSTRIYRWPQEPQELLLRLVKEERYIMPERGADLTLTVRPL